MSAASTPRINGYANMLRGSVTGSPVVLRIFRICVGVSAGLHSRSSALTPATAGAACDVPRNIDEPVPRPVEVICEPGASKSKRLVAVDVKHAIVFELVIASEHAGQRLPPSAR
jgi:hypothetical protein